MKETLQNIYLRLCLSSVFSEVLKKPLLKSYFEYCRADGTDAGLKYAAYARFVSEIYRMGGSLPCSVSRLIFEDENSYVKDKAKGVTPRAVVEDSVKRELENFSAFASLTPADFALNMGIDEREIPKFDYEKTDIKSRFDERMKEINRYGYGVFSSYGMFRVSDGKEIEPIVSADKISMAAFIGYEEEREKVVENTLAFIEGRPAANALLCGDAGTGKSSTVKAVANEFFSRGLRLIELRKDQLSLLPYVMGKISQNPLKFIIFIDDLAFNKSDDNFSMLKAALEGSASARADNAVIYATSNRRHIIKETFGDREGDEVHRNDTMQESLSLSERFGLTVFFSKPDKKLYIKIVKGLAERFGVKMDENELVTQAEAFALKKGNRSARCAEQFVQSLLR